LNPRTIALSSALAAVSIVLIPVRVPTLYFPSTYYIWEIPIIVALLLFGFKCGISVAALTAVAQPIVTPSPIGIFYPIWNFIAMTVGLVGVYLAHKLVLRKTLNGKVQRIKPAIYYVVLGVAFRVGIMPFVDYNMIRTVMPLMMNQTYTDAAVLALMPGVVLYNIVLPIYTILSAYLLARVVSKHLRVGNKLY
jgi:riboflavin transporter FmnP